MIATASAGDFDKALSFTDKNDVLDTFVSGPLVETLSYFIARGVPVVGIRANPTTAGAYGTVDETDIVGTATVAAGATIPDASYDVVVEILTGGALGTTGIVFRYSLDNGENWSEPTALGTSLTLTCARGVSFTLASAASTLIAGDSWTVTTTAPKILTGDLADSFAVLKDYSGEWLRCVVVAEADGTMLAQCASFTESFHAEGKYPEIIINTRVRGAAESRADYQTALAAVVAGAQSAEVSPAADQCELVSEVNGWRLRMLSAIPYAARLMQIDDSQDAAAKADGALPGVFLMTRNGERKYHDEFKFPGLDALGLTTLRTWGGRPVTPGVYVNNPRLIAGPGTDYRYFQHSAILNRAIESTYSLLLPRLSQGVLCDPTTGRIREDVAKSIEDAITAELVTIYQESKRCSAVRFFLSRKDNVLSTDTLTFDVKMVPLAYVKKFQGKAGLVRALAVTPT